MPATASPARRRLLRGAAATLALPGALALAQPREGIQVGPPSRFADVVPAGRIEDESAGEYHQQLAAARAAGRLVPPADPQFQRLVYIAERLRPYAEAWNPRSREWRWEVNLIRSPQVNAYCMPGGKIAVFTGLLVKLQLQDDELAMVLGHEMTHALREHARAQIGKQIATRGAIGVAGAILGWGATAHQVAGAGGQLLTLKFSRDDETEADLVGLEIAARAGYDPGAALSLWRKMMAAARNAPPEFLSDHPSSPDRLRTIAANIPRVQGLYARAPKPDRRFGPPPAPPGR